MSAHQRSSMPLPRGVKRALDAMRRDAGHEWKVAELATIAEVSGRTLQRQFLNFLGKAPRAALRDIRFQCARRKLLQGPPDVKVKDVAARSGLAHCGRFSMEYRRRYGETPSQTLKRQALFASTLVSMPSFFSSGRDRPKVVLAPIKAASENAEIARHIADQFATALMRAGISVISQPGSARYHLAGVMRGWERHTSLTFRLVETETGRHLWAHRSDELRGDNSAAAEHLATRMAAAMQPCLRLAEIDRALQKPDIDLNSHDLALRALPGVLSLNADGNARALDLLERAMDLDPGNALATALAAWAHGQRVVYHFSKNPAGQRARGLDLARKAHALAGDATVLAILGNALTSLTEFDAAELVIRKALSFDGGSAWAWSRSGWIDLYKGDAQSAIERLTIALDLAPHDSLAFNSMIGIGCAHFQAGRYLDAAPWLERALIEHPSAIWVHRSLCSAYLLGGARSDACRSLTALRKQYPELTVSDVQQSMPPFAGTYRDRVADALHTVGLPS
jgi:AraC-like DNA-binding protein/tetratricopeptide (TPR) repeat protein